MDIAELSDRTEINEALNRYTIAIDTGEFDRLDTVFTPDAQIDYSESGGMVGGLPEVKPWLAENLPAFSKKRMHTLGQVAISFANTAGRGPGDGVLPQPDAHRRRRRR